MILICLGGHWIKRCYGAVSPPPRPAIFFQPWKGNRVYLAPWIIYFSARISTGLISNIMPGCVFGRGGVDSCSRKNEEDERNPRNY